MPPRWKFEDRWRIEGFLETRTPLHLGSGRTREPEIGGSEPETALVSIDSNGRASIPASGLKGTLRAWANTHLAGHKSQMDSIFGSEAIAGVAEFWDAPVAEVPDVDPQQNWDALRATCVGTRVAIQRRTRTASHQKLFEREFVPEKTRFAVTICGSGLTEEQVRLILFLLNSFNNGEGLSDIPAPVMIGAETASGFGRMNWQPANIFHLPAEPAAVAEWLKADGVAYERLPKLSEEKQAGLIAAALAANEIATHAGTDAVFRILLEFQGPFLVNDPSRCKTKGQKADKDDPKPNHAPITDGSGRPFLPGSSFRGAFRSHAERIARTIFGDDGAGHPDKPEYLREFTVSGKSELIEKFRRCKVSPLFGSPGWRSPLSISDFRIGKKPCIIEPDPQEFIAIDRFTGGGANEKKFNAMYASSPVLEGTLTLDLNRLKDADPSGDSLSLLAYSLRDLAEGDITLGFGAAKGYGQVVAKIELTDVPSWDRLHDSTWPAITASFAKWMLDNPHISRTITERG